MKKRIFLVLLVLGIGSTAFGQTYEPLPDQGIDAEYYSAFVDSVLNSMVSQPNTLVYTLGTQTATYQVTVEKLTVKRDVREAPKYVYWIREQNRQPMVLNGNAFQYLIYDVWNDWFILKLQNGQRSTGAEAQGDAIYALYEGGKLTITKPERAKWSAKKGREVQRNIEKEQKRRTKN